MIQNLGWQLHFAARSLVAAAVPIARNFFSESLGAGMDPCSLGARKMARRHVGALVGSRVMCGQASEPMARFHFAEAVHREDACNHTRRYLYQESEASHPASA